MYRRFVRLALAAVSLAAAPLQAATFQFSYNAVTPVSGTFTTTDTLVGGFYTITSMTGTRNGLSLSLLAPGAFPSIGPNDNLLSPNTPYLNFNGVSFTDGTSLFNVFYNSNITSYFECVGAAAVCSSSVGFPGFTLTRVTAVPEPASWALMIGGLGLSGAALRRRTARRVLAA